MTERKYSIQELCEKSGLPRRTIHFYSQQGILPSPSGAGLGARYGEAHLLRLLAIPLLRREGLRLDDIRVKFENISRQELQELVERAGRETPQPKPDVKGESFTHYRLPGGVVVSAPASLNASDREKLTELLEEAQRIFTARRTTN